MIYVNVEISRIKRSLFLNLHAYILIVIHCRSVGRIRRHPGVYVKIPYFMKSVKEFHI